ncbi:MULTISPECIES: glycosyltransferase family 2 protein [Luteimonas]|uniref:glycosyltransferase family 2 protein n=1 Tax=Luteimonas TaxID=83614 RepID=UPI001E3A01F0|nr:MULTISPECIES: glycosyltransferase family 2 protein [Luteimonas]
MSIECPAAPDDRARLTILVAAFDEAQSLPHLHPRIATVMTALAADGVETRVLYVDDGSGDGTWPLLQALAAADPRVALLRLSRNFGKEAALTAGLDAIEHGAAMILDADGQDPPELIPEFVAKWRAGYDDVHGTRVSRDGEGWTKKATAHVFYRVIQRLAKTPVPADTGDYRLLSPRALAALRQLRERHRFMKGLFGWVGFNRVAVPYQREARLAGTTKFGFWRLWNFAIDGVTSFSTAPLRLATYVGVVTACAAFGFALWIVGKALAFGDPVAGWPTMMSVILFLGGVQLVALGVIGEYLGRLYEESKQRPLYLVRDWVPATDGAAPIATADEVGRSGFQRVANESDAVGAGRG